MVARQQAWATNIILRANLTALAVVLVILGSYNAYQVWATEPDQLDRKVSAYESTDELAKLRADERLVLTSRAQQTIMANPLDGGPLMLLAALARVGGNQKKANELILLAADRSLRNTKAQADVLPILLERRDYAGALYRLDGLLRSRPERLSDFLPTLIAFAEARESRSALVTVLAQNPPWRGPLISLITEKATRAAITYRLLADLRNTAAPPTIDEVRALLNRLIRDDDYETGYFVWLDYLTDRELLSVANIFDGGFELESKNLFFDWTYFPMNNVDVHFVPHTITATDRALRIDFVNPSSRFANLAQLLRLPAGSYLFSGEVKAGYEQVDSGFVWRLYCIGEQERQITQTSRPPRSEDWRHFELKFEIPESGCQTQRLQLELDSRAALDNRITGSVSFDNLAITLRH